MNKLKLIEKDIKNAPKIKLTLQKLNQSQQSVEQF